jgi:hypothetical protein
MPLTSILSPLAGRGEERSAETLKKRYLLDELSLGKSSLQRCDNVNVIGNTANAHDFGTEIPADRCKVSVDPWPHVQTNPELAILRAKDDVNYDVT